MNISKIEINRISKFSIRLKKYCGTIHKDGIVPQFYEPY